jgi:hypothetical protein
MLLQRVLAHCQANHISKNSLGTACFDRHGNTIGDMRKLVQQAEAAGVSSFVAGACSALAELALSPAGAAAAAAPAGLASEMKPHPPMSVAAAGPAHMATVVDMAVQYLMHCTDVELPVRAPDDAKAAALTGQSACIEACQAFFEPCEWAVVSKSVEKTFGPPPQP